MAPVQKIESVVTSSSRSVHYASLVALRVPEGKVIGGLIRFYRQTLRYNCITHVVVEYLESLSPGEKIGVAIFAVVVATWLLPEAPLGKLESTRFLLVSHPRTDAWASDKGPGIETAHGVERCTTPSEMATLMPVRGTSPLGGVKKICSLARMPQTWHS